MADRKGQRRGSAGAQAQSAEHAPESRRVTQDDLLELSLLAVHTGSLIFWTRGHGGDLQPLLMPVHPSLMTQH